MGNLNEMSPWNQLARCVVNSDFSVAYYLDKDNSNFKADGTSVNWSEVESSGQNVMVQIPKSYSCKKQISSDFVFGVSAQPIETDTILENDWEIDYAFYRDRTKMCDDTSANPVEVDYRYIGAFHGWMDGSGRLRSLPNKSPRVDITLGNARNAAKAMGAGWCQLDYYLHRFMQMLYITEYGHPDGQTKIGRGFVDGNSAAIPTGGTLNRGNNTFGETTGKQQMSYRGVEDWWGNVRSWLDGFFINSSGQILVSNKGFNNTGSGYENVGSGTMGGGNIRTIKPSSKAGFVPQTTGASYETGGLYGYGGLFAGRLANVGPHWSSGSSGGPFRVDGNRSASSSYSYLGLRLCG